MPLTREQVEKVSLLARLRLSEAELETMTAQLGAIVGYIEQLAELDTEKVEPMAHAVELHNVFRPDQVRPSVDRAEMLATAPSADGEFYLVPAVLGE
jgi:aspartyl-tRNA(Asn)/glutamyl-tRNA(Gln) amidotransferase subunit C